MELCYNSSDFLICRTPVSPCFRRIPLVFVVVGTFFLYASKSRDDLEYVSFEVFTELKRKSAGFCYELSSLVSLGSLQMTDAPYPRDQRTGKELHIRREPLKQNTKEVKGALTMIQAMTCREIPEKSKITQRGGFGCMEAETLQRGIPTWRFDILGY